MEKSAIKRLYRKCPVCACSSGEVMCCQRFALPESHPLPSSYDVVCCERCGFIFADSPSNQEVYDRYYREMSKYEDSSVNTGSGGDSGIDLIRMEAMADNVSGVLKDKQAAILDIGCGNGGLLVSLKKRGYSNVAGVDLSATCVEHVRQKGIDCFEGDILSLRRLGIPKRYSCIIASQIFEHILDLRSAVDVLASIVAHDGFFYVEVPDATRYFNHYVKSFHYFDCEHINHFDRASLSNLVSGHGFELVASLIGDMQLSNSVFYPALGAVYRKTGNATEQVKPNFVCRDAVHAYIDKSTHDNGLDVLRGYCSSQEEIAVWGAGSYTMRNLVDGYLGRCNIITFVDKDAKKHGKKMHSIEICHPKTLHTFSGPIVVCSAVYSSEIVREIKAMGLKNEMIVL